MRQLQLQCGKCDAILPHNQATPNHVVHALVSLFVLGLWIPVWIVIAFGSGKAPATCIKCSNVRAPTGPATIAPPVKPVEDMSPRAKAIIIGSVMAVIAWAVVANYLGYL